MARQQPYRPGRATTGKIRHREIHPIAAVFPMPGAEDVRRMKDSIKAHGVRVPVVLAPDGRVVDGRTRYWACAELGVEPPVVELRETDSLVEAVSEYNACRRDLTPDTRQQAVDQLVPWIEAEVKARQRGGDRSQADTGRTRDRVADLLGVSPATAARRIRVMKRGTPELREAVEAGRLTASLGAAVADLPEQAQREVAAAERPAKAAKVALDAAKAEPAEPPPSDEEPERWPTDERGVEVPAEVAPVFADDVLARLGRAVARLAREIEATSGLPVGAYLNVEQIGRALSSVKTMLRLARPYAVCHRCGGDGCDACLRQGWMTKDRWSVTGGPK